MVRTYRIAVCFQLFFGVVFYSEACVDRGSQAECANFLNKNICTKYKPWMTRRCALTCGLCSEVANWMNWEPWNGCNTNTGMMNRTRICTTNNCGAGESFMKKACKKNTNTTGPSSPVSPTMSVNGTDKNDTDLDEGDIFGNTTSPKSPKFEGLTRARSGMQNITSGLMGKLEPDIMFCLSVIPALRDLSADVKTMAKIQMLEALMKHQSMSGKSKQ